MLDIKFVRENPEIVKQNIKNKFQDSKIGLVDEAIELDEKKRSVQREADALRAERNAVFSLFQFNVSVWLYLSISSQVAGGTGLMA